MSTFRGHSRAGFLAIVATMALLSQTLWAQQDGGPLRGVVWTPPNTFPEIRKDLEMISEYGVQVVRVGLVHDENTYVLSDLFGVEFFQEIDLAFAPAEVAAARTDELVAQIDSMLEVASRMSEAIYLGLGYWNDTSDDRTCTTLSALANAAHRRFAAVRTYYITPFIEDDKCSHTVDFVLLDSKDQGDPTNLIERWRRTHDTPVGIAALGAPVRPQAGTGYLVPGSPEAQARFIESTLTELLEDDSLVAVFVDRWVESNGRGALSNDIDGDFGIISPDGSPRPAAEVVRGFYTGRQRVFAFPAGSRAPIDYSWMNLLAFVTAALFGFTFYSSLGLQSVLRRYFLSHSFYLEKVGDGREAAIGISLFLLACLSIAASIVGTALVTHLRLTNLWFALTAWLPGSLSWALRVGERYQGLLVLTFAVLFALVALLWAVVLSWLTPTTKKLKPAQTLLLVVMPRWPVAIIGLLVLVVLNWQVDAPVVVIATGTGVWLSVVIVYTGRMFSDYLRLLGITALLTIPVLFLALTLIAATGWLFVTTQNLLPELIFLWNLATRT